MSNKRDGIWIHINEENMDKIENWLKNHDCEIAKERKDRNQSVAVAVAPYHYEITPTAMGEMITIACMCGKRQYIDESF